MLPTATVDDPAAIQRALAHLGRPGARNGPLKDVQEKAH
jgi:hypothetical protein